MPSGKNSFSSSLEIYAAVGGDPDTYEVEDLFIAGSRAVLKIDSENNRTQLSAEVEVIDCDKMGVYFGSGDGIVCFSIEVTVLVTSDGQDLSRIKPIAKKLAEDAKLAVTKGDFQAALTYIEAPIEVLLMEMAPDSSSSDEDDSDDCASLCVQKVPDGCDVACDEDENDDCDVSCDEDENDDCVALCDEDENDNCEGSYDEEENDGYEDSIDFHDFEVDDDDINDDDDVSSMCSTEFDAFLEVSYREYLQDVNRKEILARINPPKSPPTVSAFPPECSKKCICKINPPCNKENQLKPRTSKVKFDSMVRVRNTLSRHDMTPHETYSYWFGQDEFMTKEDRAQMLKVLTEKWTIENEQKCRPESDNKDDVDASLLMPVLPQIKRLLPKAELESHDGYTYTISIKS